MLRKFWIWAVIILAIICLALLCYGVYCIWENWHPSEERGALYSAIEIGVSAVLAIAALIIAVLQLSAEKMQERIQTLKQTDRMIINGRDQFSNRMLEVYHTPEGNAWVKSSYLLSLNGWSLDQPLNLKNTTSIDFAISEGGYPFKKRLGDRYSSHECRRYLPDKSMTFFDNSAYHLGKFLFDSDVFTLRGIDIDGNSGTIRFNVSVDRYEDYYNTCQLISTIATSKILKDPQCKESITL